MADTPDTNDDGVLRPFTPAEQEPLPPVEPSSVVVPPPVEEPIVPPPPPPPPVEAPVVPPPPPSGESVDPWTPPPGEVGGDDEGDGWLDALGTSGLESEPEPQLVDPVAESEPELPAAPAADSPTMAGALPTAGPGPDSIVLRRTPFLVGAGVIALVLLALLLLWQTAGDGGSDSEVQVADVDSPDPVDDGGDDVEPDAVEPAVDPELVAEVDTLRSANTDLTGQVAGLEAELASQPLPALPGTALRRIVVAADASYVSVGDNSVAVIGPFGGYASIDPVSNIVTASGQVASGATRVMRTDTAVWITNYTDGEIVRVNPVANVVVSTFPFPGPDGIAKNGSFLAVASFDGGFVARVDPASGEIVAQVDVGGSPSAVQVRDNAIWAAVFNTGELVRIDSETFEVTNRVVVGAGPAGLMIGPDRIWVANHEEGSVAAVDLASNEVVHSIVVGGGPTELIGHGGFIWVTLTDAGDVIQIDPTTGEVITRTPLGASPRGGPTGIAAGEGSVWVAVQGERSVVRITLPAS